MNKVNHKEIIDTTLNRINTAFKEPITDLEYHNHYVDLSIGVISGNVKMRDWTLLICLADKLMYKSKSKTDHRTICYDEDDLKKMMKGFD